MTLPFRRSVAFQMSRANDENVSSTETRICLLPIRKSRFNRIEINFYSSRGERDVDVSVSRIMTDAIIPFYHFELWRRDDE